MSNIVAVLRQVCGTVAATDPQPTQDMQFKLVLFESEHTIRLFTRSRLQHVRERRKPANVLAQRAGRAQLRRRDKRKQSYLNLQIERTRARTLAYSASPARSCS